MPTFTPEPSRPASCAETTALSFTGHRPPISSAYADGDNTNNKEAANTPNTRRRQVYLWSLLSFRSAAQRQDNSNYLNLMYFK